MSVHHPYYMVDPSLLPAAGVKRTLDGPPSASLAARQERLHKWHVDQQHKGLAKLGLATVSSGKTPRDMGGGAQGSHAAAAPHVAPGQALHRRKDPRFRGHATSAPPPGSTCSLIESRLGFLIDGLRRQLQQEAFASLDINGDGVISVQDLRQKFSNSTHPDVLVRIGLQRCVLCHDGQKRVALAGGPWRSMSPRGHQACCQHGSP